MARTVCNLYIVTYQLIVDCCSPIMSISARNRKGYPTDIFRDIQVPIAKYLCELCKLVLKNPVQRFCGHRYCKKCIDEVSEASAESVTVCSACNEDDIQEEVPDSSVGQVSLGYSTCWERGWGHWHGAGYRTVTVCTTLKQIAMWLNGFW